MGMRMANCLGGLVSSRLFFRSRFDFFLANPRCGSCAHSRGFGYIMTVDLCPFNVSKKYLG